MANLKDLPDELLLKIGGHLSKSDLSALCRSSSYIIGPMRQLLFRTISCSMVDNLDFLKILRAIRHRESLSELVREIHISSCNHSACVREFGFENYTLGQLSVAFGLICNFLQLKAVVFSLEDICQAHNWHYRENFSQTIPFRILSELFNAAANRKLSIRGPYSPPFLALMLYSVPALYEPSLINSSKFRNCMRKVAELTLSFNLIYYGADFPSDAFRGMDIPARPEPHDFAAHFTDWLGINTCEDRAKLSLKFPHRSERSGMFGLYPKFDLRKAKYSNRKELRLADVAFSHNWQIDWICSHNRLEVLSLVDCSIIIHMTTQMTLDHDGFPTPNKPWGRFIEMPLQLRWCTVLERFSQELPRLRDIQITWFDGDIMPDNRYVEYDCGHIRDEFWGSSSLAKRIAEEFAVFDKTEWAMLVEKTDQWKKILGKIFPRWV